jgi:hypothetical protein
MHSSSVAGFTRCYDPLSAILVAFISGTFWYFYGDSEPNTQLKNAFKRAYANLRYYASYYSGWPMLSQWGTTHGSKWLADMFMVSGPDIWFGTPWIENEFTFEQGYHDMIYGWYVSIWGDHPTSPEFLFLQDLVLTLGMTYHDLRNIMPSIDYIPVVYDWDAMRACLAHRTGWTLQYSGASWRTKVYGRYPYVENYQFDENAILPNSNFFNIYRHTLAQYLTERSVSGSERDDFDWCRTSLSSLINYTTKLCPYDGGFFNDMAVISSYQ